MDKSKFILFGYSRKGSPKGPEKMSTYLDYIPEELIVYEIAYYLFQDDLEKPYQDLRNLIQLLPESTIRLIAYDEFATGLIDLILKYMGVYKITWREALSSIYYYEDLIYLYRTEEDERRQMTLFLGSLANIRYPSNDNRSYRIKAIDTTMENLETRLSEFVFNVFTHYSYPGVINYNKPRIDEPRIDESRINESRINKIRLVTHILEKNEWYYLHRAVTEFIEKYHKNYDTEAQQGPSVHIYFDILETFYNYIYNGTIIPYKLKMMSIQRIPILLVYLYYMEELILGIVEFDDELASELVKTMIRELPIKLGTVDQNYQFLMNSFQNPQELIRVSNK